MRRAGAISYPNENAAPGASLILALIHGSRPDLLRTLAAGIHGKGFSLGGGAAPPYPKGRLTVGRCCVAALTSIPGLRIFRLRASRHGATGQNLTELPRISAGAMVPTGRESAEQRVKFRFVSRRRRHRRFGATECRTSSLSFMISPRTGNRAFEVSRQPICRPHQIL